MRHVFLVPDAAAAITGGNLYNAALVGALRDAGVDAIARPLSAGEPTHDDGPEARYWLDSLYLDALPRLRRAGRRVRLVAHWLPSLARLGVVPAPAELSDEERAALALADGFVVPSAFMASALAALGAAARPVTVVAPGLDAAALDAAALDAALLDAAAPEAPATVERGGPLRAIVVANVVPNKRVLPLLDALAPALRAGAALALTIAGSVTMDRDYARACADRVASDPALGAAVRLAGAVAHEALLARVAASELLLSPSCMESFGLALAEARALGVPVVARAGGNAAAHVEPRAGGILADSDAALAEACARLAADRDELGRRRAAARAARPPRRSWADAARDFLAAQRGAPSQPQRAPGSE